MRRGGAWLAILPALFSACSSLGGAQRSADAAVQPGGVDGRMRITARTSVPADLPRELVKPEPIIERAIAGMASRIEGPTPARILLVSAGYHPIQPVFLGPNAEWCFSVTALKGLRFDNELAAAVAAAKALALSPPELGNSWRAVTRVMVRTLYSAGYDPRGVSSFWRSWAEALRRRATPEASDPARPTVEVWLQMAAELEEEARIELAKLPPLLNPVVRTAEFATISKRLQNL